MGTWVYTHGVLCRHGHTPYRKIVEGIKCLGVRLKGGWHFKKKTLGGAASNWPPNARFLICVYVYMRACVKCNGIESIEVHTPNGVRAVLVCS